MHPDPFPAKPPHVIAAYSLLANFLAHRLPQTHITRLVVAGKKLKMVGYKSFPSFEYLIKRR